MFWSPWSNLHWGTSLSLSLSLSHTHGYQVVLRFPAVRPFPVIIREQTKCLNALVFLCFVALLFFSNLVAVLHLHIPYSTLLIIWVVAGSESSTVLASGWYSVGVAISNQSRRRQTGWRAGRHLATRMRTYTQAHLTTHIHSSFHPRTHTSRDRDMPLNLKEALLAPRRALEHVAERPSRRRQLR